MWLHLPMSVSLPASEGSTLPSSSLFQRLAASVMWRSSFRPWQSWQRVWKTVPWMMRLSGLTSEPSPANSIVAAWLEQFSASPARISLSRESRREWAKEPEADSSSTPCDPFARLDANGVFWRTSPQFSLFLQDTPYSENLPKAGSMRNGFLYERPMSALRTAGNGSSSWPTARAEDSECCGNHPGGADSLGGAAKGWSTPSTEDFKTDGPAALGRYGTPEMMDCDQRSRNQAQMWHTPHGMAGRDASGKQGGGGEFAKQATQWPTPDASMSSGGRQSAEPMATTRPSGTKKAITLNDAAQEKMWTTPQAHDSGAAELLQTPAVDSFRSRGGIRKDEMGLDQQARMQWVTPATRDWKGANSETHVTETGGGRRHMDQLINQVEHSFLPDQPTENDGQPSSETAPTSPRRLNPKFVEWLQGMPEGWTSAGRINSEALGTWFAQSRERLRCLCCLDGQEGK